MTVKKVIIWSLVIGIFVIPTIYYLLVSIRQGIAPTQTIETSAT